MTPITLNLAALVSIAVSFFLPLLVGLVTKMSTHSGVKAVLLILLSSITAWLAQYLTANSAGQSFDWKTTGLAALVGFATAVAAHFGVWKQTGATAAVQATLVTDRGTAPPA